MSYMVAWVTKGKIKRQVKRAVKTLAKRGRRPRLNALIIREDMNLTALNSILALAPPAQPGTQPNPTGQLLSMLGMFAFFGILLYVMTIRPQQKRAKEHAELLQNLKPGDKIVTSGGILGVVVAIKDKTVSIRSADTKLEVLKSAISEVTERTGGASQS